MRYTKKPIAVSAVKVISIDDDEVVFDESEEQLDWILEALEKGVGENGGLWLLDKSLRIGTLEGVLLVKAGDFIVRGVRDELYPVRGDIFAETYEPVASP